MAPTSRQISQLIREELSRALRESRSDRDVTGYEYLRDERKKMRPLLSGPVDDAWVAEKLSDLNRRFPPYMLPMIADDFAKAAVGRGDPDVAMRYRSAGVTRETMEALVAALGGASQGDEG